MAKLLTRSGRRIAALASLQIAYPVGRSGARFEALLPTSAIGCIEIGKLLRFVIQDDAGSCFPAMIDRISVGAAQAEWSTIGGVLVAHG